MLRSCVVALLLTVTTGCYTRYHPIGFFGGYTDRRVGAKKWLVRFDGNGYTSTALAQSYAHRRAQEVCESNGFTQYELLDQSASVAVTRRPDEINCQTYGPTTSCSTRAGRTSERPSVELFITCSGGPRPSTLEADDAIVTPNLPY